KQELARVGYNPAKRGRASYHPLLCFNGLTKDFWQGELRSGLAYTGTEAVTLLKASFAQLPSSVKTVTMRGDKGFYDHKIIEYLETQHAHFAIAAKLTKRLKEKLPGLAYRKYASGFATAEFLYQPQDWKKPYRFVAIRRPIAEDPTEQLTLFTVSKHTYQVIVTDLSLLPFNVWKYYNDRAAVELIIKELKGSYPLAKIPSHHFAANEAYFHLLLFSYNLINWFKRLCLPKEFHRMTLATLRSRLLLVPSELTTSDNKPTLKLPANFLYKDAFTSAMKKIDKLKI
ncbi:MAG: IS1380 family transposase, partial [Acidobacteria bacterium]